MKKGCLHENKIASMKTNERQMKDKKGYLYQTKKIAYWKTNTETNKIAYMKTKWKLPITKQIKLSSYKQLSFVYI